MDTRSPSKPLQTDLAIRDVRLDGNGDLSAVVVDIEHLSVQVFVLRAVKCAIRRRPCQH